MYTPLAFRVSRAGAQRGAKLTLRDDPTSPPGVRLRLRANRPTRDPMRMQTVGPGERAGEVC